MKFSTNGESLYLPAHTTLQMRVFVGDNPLTIDLSEDLDDRKRDYQTDTVMRPKHVIYWPYFVTRRRTEEQEVIKINNDKFLFFTVKEEHI
jgi:hypothetical protein